MLFRNILYRSFKRKIKRNWNKTNIPESIELELQENREQYQKLYDESLYWHGTGRYHYSNNGKSKYENVDRDKTIDVLLEIIKDNGIKIHDDPWVKVNGDYSSSLSTTEWRMYARIYAELHMNENSEPILTYGNREDIIKFFFNFTMASSPPIALLKGITASFDKKRYATKGPNWSATINDSIQTKGNAFSDLLHILGYCNSNIESNYGILFGIKENNIPKPQINPIIQMFETRFTKKIDLDTVSHIEAPIKNMTQTKELLNSNQITLPVVSVEAMELLSSDLPITFRKGESDKLPTFNKKDLIAHYNRDKK